MSALAAGIIVLVVAIPLAGAGHGPLDVANAFVQRLVARDPTAADLLYRPSALEAIAGDVGIGLLPATVRLAIDAPQMRVIEGATDESAEVIGTWTMTATGDGGLSEAVAQKATVLLEKDASGHWVVDTFSVGPSLTVDLASYFGDMGTAQASRDAALADLRSGTAWLSVSNIDPVDSTTQVNVDPVVTDDPDSFESQSRTTAEGVIGEVTHWAIDVGDGRSPIEISSGTTVAARPAEVMRGVLTDAGVLDSAVAAARSWVQAIQAGDADAVAQVTDASVVSPAAWTRMKLEPPDLAADASADFTSRTPIVVQVGSLRLVRQLGGSWLIDAENSALLRDWLPGTGKTLTIRNFAALVDFSDCLGTTTGATSRMSLDGIGFYGQDLPGIAVFRFAAKGDLHCAGGIRLYQVTTTWQGHAEPEYGFPDAYPANDTATSTIRVELPSDVTNEVTPIRIDVLVKGHNLDYSIGEYTASFTADAP